MVEGSGSIAGATHGLNKEQKRRGRFTCFARTTRLESFFTPSFGIFDQNPFDKPESRMAAARDSTPARGRDGLCRGRAWFCWVAFGGPDALAFSIVSGGFTAVMDFLSAFVMRNYRITWPVSALGFHRRRPDNPARKKVNATVGEYIESVAARSLFSPKTLQSYAQALRKIAGDIAGEAKREKRDLIKLRTSRQRRSKPGALNSSAGRPPIP